MTERTINFCTVAKDVFGVDCADEPITLHLVVSAGVIFVAVVFSPAIVAMVVAFVYVALIVALIVAAAAAVICKHADFAFAQQMSASFAAFFMTML